MSARLALLGVIVSLIAGMLALAPAAGGAGPSGGGDPVYKNGSYTPAERAADLVARMTLAEKASQMVSSQSPAIPRLGINAYGWWNEASHGVSYMQLAPGFTSPIYNTTVYPDDLALASSWDPSLAYSQASAISDEAREIAPDNALDLDFYSPTVNMARDPRWGRNDETFSEDPFLTGTMAAQYVDGLEGLSSSGHVLPQGGGFLKAIATPKHYAANNNEDNRLDGSSNMDERTLREYYTAQFRQIIAESHPGALMAAYNSINGRPAPVNDHLVDAIARKTYGFNGYVTSDCDAIDDVVNGHYWQPPGYSRPANETEARAIANATGVDLNCTLPYVTFNYANTLPAAVNEGIRTPTDSYNVQDMDTSLVRLFTARMELGEFSNIGREPWVGRARAQLAGAHWTNSEANGADTETPSRLFQSRVAADRSLVLLNNATLQRRDGSVGPVLPILVPRAGPFKVALIGYFANKMYFGDYSSIQGAAGAARSVTPYAGLKAAIQAINPSAQVDLYNGFVGGNSAGTLGTIDPNAVSQAAGYNDVIVVAGTDASTGSEGYDRPNLALPGAQDELIHEVAAQNPNTVAVLETAGDVNVSDLGSVPAMLWSGFNGQEGGVALADVVLGEYDPSGHLPFTWYQSDGDLPSIEDYRIRPGSGTPGRTYEYYRGPISYPFGYGLSYTSFTTSNLRFDRLHLTPNDTLQASVDVTNTGAYPGEDLVQLYVTTPGAGGSKPIKRLEGFQQVELSPGQTKAVSLAVKIADLGFWDGNHMSVENGNYGIQIGSSADNVLLQRDIGVGGKLTPIPSTVTASPTMSGDAKRQIKQRVMFPVQTQVLPQLSVAMNDESLYGDVSSAHSSRLPSGLSVRYTTDHPKVVSISGAAIRTVANGVATVTATVTYHGHSAATQFVVRVLSQLSGISVKTPAKSERVKGGQGKARTRTGGGSFVPLPGFYPDAFDYDVLVPNDLHAPRIRANSPDRRARVRVQQAAEVPGTASVAVTGPDGLTSTYRVHFARPARSDAFTSGRLGSQWRWVRFDPASTALTTGGLVIAPQPGDLTPRTARNVLLQPALGDWTIESRVTFSSLPSLPGQQAGVMAYQDDQNYLKLDVENDGGPPQLVEWTENNLSGQPVSQLLASATPRGNIVWLRMVKRGPHYTTYYSFDGVHFARLYSIGASLTDVQAGLLAFSGGSPNNGLNVSFGYFHAQNSGPLTLGAGPLH